MILLNFGLLLIACVAGLPPPEKRSEIGPASDDPVGLEKRRSDIPANFHRLYVSSNGEISNQTDDEASTIEVYGSPRTSKIAMDTAATIVARITRNMPTVIFNNLATSGTGAGVFTTSEKVTIYPDFSYHKNSFKDCGRSCKGSCAYTCTTDGRKYEDLPSMSGRVVAVADDNLMCGPWEPYSHKKSILVSEFARTVKLFGLGEELEAQVDDAYIAARNAKTWKVNKYAMRTSDEYWAQASSVFMGVNHLSEWNAAGMNFCHPSGPSFCRNEEEGRQKLKSKDPKLYDVLVKAYTSGKPKLAMQLTICPPSATVYG